MLQEQMMNDNPIYVPEEMRDIAESVSTFSFNPIGPIADCVVSMNCCRDQYHNHFKQLAT